MEQELIQQSRQGDLGAFNQLVALYQRPVYNLALRMLGNSATAEDVAQEVFLAAYRALPRYREGSFRAWLFAITANASRDALRKQKRRPEVSLDESPGGSDLHASSGPSPEEYTLSRETQREVQQALSRLTDDHRAAILLVDLQSLDYQEAAQALGVSLGTLKSRLSRARAQLKEHLLAMRGTLEP